MPFRGRAPIGFLLLLWLVSLPQAALLAQGQENEASIACAIPTNYSEFWERPSWWSANPNVIHTEKFDIYSGGLQRTQSSFGAEMRATASPDSEIFTLPSDVPLGNFSKVQSGVRMAAAAMSSAKTAYEEQKYWYALVAKDVEGTEFYSKLRPFISLGISPSGTYAVQNFVFLTIEDLRKLIGLPSMSNYSSSWTGSMKEQMGALSSSSGALNDAFSSCERVAQDLRTKGAGMANYSGEAKGAYYDWANFARGASEQCAQIGKWENSTAPSPTSSTPSGRYGKALLAATLLRDVSSEPAFVPNFSPTGSEQADFAALSFGENDSRLWLDAKGHYIALSRASDAMDKEYSVSEKQSDDGIASLEYAIHTLNKSDISLFTGYESIVPPSSNISAAAIAGTPQERFAKLLALQGEAKKLRESALISKRETNRQGYLSDAILLHKYSAISSSVALSEAGNLSETLVWLASLAEEDAADYIGLLESAVSDGKNYNSAALDAALSDLNASRDNFAHAKLKASIGEKYALMRNASSLAARGIDALHSPFSLAGVKELNGTFSRAKTLADALASSCPEENSDDIKNGISLLRRQASLLPYSPDFLQGAQGLESAANARLERCFAPLTERYNSLRSLISLSSLQGGTFAKEFDAEFAPYRKGNGWSAKAHSSLSQVNSLLIKWEEKTLSQSQSTAKDAICRTLVFIPSQNQFPVRSSSQIDVGGTLLAAPAINAPVAVPFDVSCTLPSSLPTLTNITSKPPFVTSASISGKTAKISFSSLPAGEKFSIAFSSLSVPFDARISSSEVFASPNGDATWSAEGMLLADTDSDALELVLPLPQEASSPILTIGTQGGRKSYSGRILSNSSGTFALFGIGSVQNGATKFSLLCNLAPTPVFHFSPLGQTGGEYSSDISITQLPQADHLTANLTEPLCADATAVQLSPKGQYFISVSGKQLGKADFSLELHPIPSSGEAQFQLRCTMSDSARLAREKLAQLLPLATNKSSVLSYLAAANNSLNSGKYDSALALLADAQNELSKISSDESATKQYSYGRDDALASLASLRAAAKSAPEGSAFSRKLLSAANSLTAAISDADGYLLQRQPEKALSKLRSALSDSDATISSSAQEEYSRMKARLDAAKLSSSSLEGNALLDGLLQNSTLSLSEMRSALLDGNASALLSASLSADSDLASAELLIGEFSSEGYNSLSAQIGNLTSSQKSLEERTANYTSMLSRISAGKGNYAPLLDQKAANSLTSSSSKALDDAKAFAAKKNTSLDELRKKTSLAEQSISLAALRLSEGEAHLASQAAARARIAKAAASSVQNGTALSAQLSSDLELLSRQIEEGNHAEAILQADAIISRATKSLSAQGAGNSLPLPLILITACLVFGLAYIFFFRRKAPSDEKKPEEKAKLERKD